MYAERLGLTVADGVAGSVFRKQSCQGAYSMSKTKAREKAAHATARNMLVPNNQPK